MNTCWKCEEPSEPGDRFCGSCGADQSARPTNDEATVAVANVTQVASPTPVTAEPELSSPPAAAGAQTAVATAEPAPPPEAEPVATPAAPAPVPAPEPAAAPLPAPSPVAAADPEPTQVAAAVQLVVDPVEPIAVPTRGQVREAVGARLQLWADVDAAGTLLATIEAASKETAGVVGSTVESHARLTSGPDLLAELRAVEIEIRNYVQAIGERASKITAHEAEIARLNRNKMILMLAVGALVLFLIIVIASAL